MKYNKTFREALQQVREDGHTDVASAVRQCKTAIEDASQMLSKLQGMNPEDSLPSWWMNKIAIAANSMNKLRDYLLVPSTNEAKEEVEKKDEKEVPKEEPQEKDSSGEIENLKSQIQALKQQLENEKNKAVKPEPNPDTGEVPLRTGLAQALLDKSTPPPELKSLDKKKLKMSLGKTKIDVNPDVEIGVFSGGKQTTSGNLH